jgi:putative sugar O-methyltransferase
MDIAILRTPAADQHRRYNGVEYAAAFHGARVIAYVDENGAGELRGYPVIPADQLTAWGVQLVVAPTPLTPELVAPLERAGWPAGRLLSYATNPADCIRFFSTGRWLSSRGAALVDGVTRMQVTAAEIVRPAVAPVAPTLPATALKAISARVFEAYKLARRDAPTTGPYAVGRNWGNFMKNTRPNFYRAVEQNDLSAITDLLADCLRNELTSGTFSGGEASATYRNYARAGEAVFTDLRQQFKVWRCSVARPDIARVASPPVGNPYGVCVDGHIVHANTFLNDYRAEAVLNLVRNVPRPVILDLGGGFGGFGQQLQRHESHGVYIGVDLPENLLVASYFLMVANPTKRVLLYESPDQPLDADTLAKYDIVMLPNFMLPSLPDRAVDVFTNFISLSEMDYANIEQYLAQVDRVCRGYFFHENLLDNGENYEFFPVGSFPALRNFAKVSSAPSRWAFFGPGSTHHNHGEFLFVNREIEHARYLTPAAPRASALNQAA